MTLFVERRLSLRVPIQCEVKYHYLSPGSNSPPLHTIDLSLGGARLESLDPLVPGASVWFYLIPSDKSIFEAGAQVAHREPGNQPPYRIGVRFTQLSHESRSIIAREIERAA